VEVNEQEKGKILLTISLKKEGKYLDLVKGAKKERGPTPKKIPLAAIRKRKGR